MVYVLDGLLYTLTHWPRHLLAPYHPDQSDPSATMPSEAANTDSESKPHEGKLKKRKLDSKSRFFERTESVLVSREDSTNTQISNDRFFGVNGGATLALENPELVGPPNQWGKQVESFSRPLHEEYPLASRPHLLKPFARKEVLFGGGEGGGADRSQPVGAGGHRKEVKKGRKRKHSSANDRSR